MKFERFKMHSLHIYIEQSCNFRYRWYIFIIARIFSFNRLIKITRIYYQKILYLEKTIYTQSIHRWLHRLIQIASTIKKFQKNYYFQIIFPYKIT